jgi:hypothetical protein
VSRLISWCSGQYGVIPWPQPEYLWRKFLIAWVKQPPGGFEAGPQNYLAGLGKQIFETRGTSQIHCKTGHIARCWRRNVFTKIG